MNLAALKDFFGKLDVHRLPTGAAVLFGPVLIFLVFKTGKFLMKLPGFPLAMALFAGAYWWHIQK